MFGPRLLHFSRLLNDVSTRTSHIIINKIIHQWFNVKCRVLQNESHVLSNSLRSNDNTIFNF